MGQRRQSEDEREINDIVRKLAGRDPVEREAANAMLESGDDDFRRQVIEQLMHNIRASRRRVGWFAGLSFLPMFLFVFQPDPLLLFGLGGGLTLITLAPAAWTLWGPLQRKTRVLALVSALSDASAGEVGFLMESARYSFRHTLETCEALEQLVARVQSGERGVITGEQARRLATRVANHWEHENRVLRRLSRGQYEIQIRTLSVMVRLLAAVGGKNERDQLERLTKKSLPGERAACLQASVLDVLPAWNARLAEEQASASLLRASAKSEVSDTLLRPTIGGAPVEPQQMLRASSESGNSPL